MSCRLNDAAKIQIIIQLAKYFFVCAVVMANETYMNTALIRNEYSPAEALWAMYMSQSKAVRNAFRVRLHAEEEAELRRKEMEEYAKALPAEELEAAERMVESVKQSVFEVKKAAEEGRAIGLPAEDLLADLFEEA